MGSPLVLRGAPELTWDTSCPDWAARIARGASLVPGLPLDKAAADRAVGIFNALRLPDVIGQPTMAEGAGEWVRDLVRAIAGSWDGRERHIREFFAVVPKKNGKTTKGAGIMVTVLLTNLRPRAEFLLVAPTQEIAGLAFRQAVGMIEADKGLAPRFHVRDHLKTIIYRPTGAFLKIKSFDPKVVTGSKPAGVLLDELHVIAEAKDADRVIGQLRGGMISQPEAFLLTITTQSERQPSGVFKAELSKARAVRDGRLKAPLLAMIYEFPPGVDWRDPANWWMVTPNNGFSITTERLQPDWDAAKAAGPEEERRWASQHLNVEIGLGLLADGWPGAEHWEAAADATLTLDTLLARSEVCTVGIDGGGLDDLLGLTVIGRERGTRRWLSWSRAWAHPIVLHRRKEIAARLRDFAADGDLVMVESLGDDLAEAAAICARIRDAGLLPASAGIGLDPAGIGSMVDALAEVGIEGAILTGVRQGGWLNGAIKAVDRGLASDTLRHAAQPMMGWCAGNAKVEPVGNSIRVTKQASGWAKIDPLSALFDAAEMMARSPTAYAADPAAMIA